MKFFGSLFFPFLDLLLDPYLRSFYEGMEFFGSPFGFPLRSPFESFFIKSLAHLKMSSRWCVVGC